MAVPSSVKRCHHALNRGLQALFRRQTLFRRGAIARNVFVAKAFAKMTAPVRQDVACLQKLKSFCSAE